MVNEKILKKLFYWTCASIVICSVVLLILDYELVGSTRFDTALQPVL